MFRDYSLLKPRINIPVSHVQVLPKFFLRHEIEAIHRIADNFHYQDASIIGKRSDQNIVVRQSQIKWIEWNDSNWWIYTKIMDKVQALNFQIWKFELVGSNEYLQYTEYSGNQSSRGHYDWHLDVGHQGPPSTRKLTFECVLNHDFTGGEFAMLLGPSENRLNLNEGDAVVYPSFLMNKVYPVTSGVRKSVVSWIAGPSFK